MSRRFRLRDTKIPMNIVESISGFLRPNRLIERPPDPPSDLLSGVGLGDFWTTGRDQVALIGELAALAPSDRVLEIGCGLGRIAWPLSGRLDRRGRYAGLDTAWPYVDWCNRNLGLNPSRFWFHHLDVANTTYNATGSIQGEAASLPYEDRSFDLVLAISLFTHLGAGTTARYLPEAARVLRPNGRLFASFFVIDPEAEERLAAGATGYVFTTRFEEGLLADAANPDIGVGYFDRWLLGRFDDAGLRVSPIHRGAWCGGNPRFFQDIIVARNTRHGDTSLSTVE